jgi:hypothetical protein
VASAADIVAAIGATFVTNATNATNATNTVNVGVTNDALLLLGILSWVSAASGNQPTKVSSANLSFVPSTGILSATGFSGNGAVTSLTAANLTGTISAAVLGNSTFLLVLQQLL